MIILSIESSCDETAAAVIKDGRVVLSDIVHSQVKIHAKWGGVVPEIASRNHLIEVIPVIEQALIEAQVTWSDIDAIAVTQGPGLVGALLVGLQVAKSLAYVHQKPLIPVHHLRGHLSAVALHAPDEPAPPIPDYPFLALVVSGGHTAIYRVDSSQDIKIISNTQDDAAGEAFDKVSRMLGLGYPGGPVIEKEAQGGQDDAYRFTLPNIKAAPLDFSFSGLKTAVLTKIKKHGHLPTGQDQKNLLASFQAAAVHQLVTRCKEAMKQEAVQRLVISGGVACNQRLREELKAAVEAKGGKTFIPPKKWCTDNAAMIAAAAYTQAELYMNRGAHADDDLLNAMNSWAVNDFINPLGI
ncbi:MAG: tRNA (adenosine(37)-N6)-threonylcarbamoyltransferase complex transferase subunit TsaD [Myxococcales bacterium]|nr:tRNA (adenosine(37)-N6)-threonylcarbamoyltransferase complex transferase subunit TsaD [Myxococcales bacterium]